MSRLRQARLERAATELRRIGKGDQAAAVRAAIRDPAAGPSDEVAALGVRVRITGYMMLALSGSSEERVLELLARDGIVLDQLELEAARLGLRRHLTALEQADHGLQA